MTGGSLSTVVEIGGEPIRVSTDDPAFLDLLEGRYARFVTKSPVSEPFHVYANITLDNLPRTGDDLTVNCADGVWRIRRGDFEAECSLVTRTGWTRQSPNPYSIDSLLRILHSLLLAPQGGFLLHAASAVRNGRAYVFTGVSGAGKTTISRLAPPDVSLLTDEISYIRPDTSGIHPDSSGYRAFGTPFAGELGEPGKNISAPLAAVYILAKGPENRIEPVSAAEATRTLLRNVLFFAEDPALVNAVFGAVCEFVSRVPVRRLTFFPDARVWEYIS